MKQQADRSSSRRDFIKLSTLLTTGAAVAPSLLGSCRKKSVARSNIELFDILRGLKVAVRTSKDHLKAQHDQCVAQKDAQAIFAFVRDRIQTLPNVMAYISAPGSERISELRWGASACLRYAGGTFLEKALLLANMLEQAGYATSLRKGPFHIATIGYDRVFFRDFDSLFAVDENHKEMWNEIPNRFKQSPKSIGPDDASHQAAVTQVLKSLPQNFVYPAYDWSKLCQQMYEVETSIDGKTVVFNPSIAAAALGESFIAGKSVKCAKPTLTEKLKVSLLLGNAKNPQKPVEFVSGDIPLEILFGNQLVVSFQSSLDAITQLTAPRYAITTLTPVIGLAGDVSDDDKKKYTFFSKSIHLDGRILERKEDVLLVDGTAISPAREHPELRAKTSELAMSVGISRFPTVDVFADALDAQGSRIDGMEGADFLLFEDGVSIPYQVLRNKPQPVKILILIDYSGSMPKPFRDDGGDQVFVKELLSKLSALQVNAEFRVANFAQDELLYTMGWSTSNDEVLASMSQIQKKAVAGSQLWEVLQKATSSEASMVLFLTDGGAVDNPSMEEKMKLSEGCPAVILGIGEQVKQEVIDAMADYSGGISRAFADHAPALDFLLDYTKKNSAKSYHLAYKSHSADTNARKVQLHLKDRDLRVESSFTAPAIKERIAPGWTGIYLKIHYKNKTVTRKLAGMPINQQVETFNPVLVDYQRETNAAFFGDFRVCVEGAEPNTANLLEELVDARLDQETYWKSYRAKKTNDAIAALEKGFHSYPDRYFHMQQRFAKNSGKDFITYQDGLKVTLFSTLPAKDGNMTQNVDLLPFTQWRTMALDPKNAFERTIDYSLRYMNLERANFTWSTMALLKDQTLESKNRPNTGLWLRNLSKQLTDKDLYANWDWAVREATGDAASNQLFVLPSQPDKIAFYTLHQDSGSMLGMIKNAAGGAGEDMQSRYDELNRLMSFMQLSLGKLNLVSPAFQLWVELEKAKMKWLTTATITLMTMQAPSPGEIDDMFYSSACDFLFAAIGSYVEVIGALGDISTVLDFMSLPHISGCSVER